MAGYNGYPDPNQDTLDYYINYPEEEEIEDAMIEERAIHPDLRGPVQPAQVNASFSTYTNQPSSQPPTPQFQNPSSGPASNPTSSQFSNFPTNPTQNQFFTTPGNSVLVPWYEHAAQGNPASTAGIYAPLAGSSNFPINPIQNQHFLNQPVYAPSYNYSTSAYPAPPESAYRLAPTVGGQQLALPIPENYGPPSTNTSPATAGSAFTGSSPAVYPNPNGVSSQTPGTTPGDSEPATTQGRKRQRETSPSTEQPRRTRRKTSNLSGPVVYNDSPADDSGPNAATSVSGSARNCTTTQSQSKAKDSGTSTPASRKKPGKRGKSISVRPARMKQLAEPDQRNPLYTKANRKKKGDDKEANDDTGSKKTRGGNEIIDVWTKCDFCANHPDGRALFNVNPVCDWEQIDSGGGEVFNRECSNCANYRSRHPLFGQGARDHMCKVQGEHGLLDFKHKKHGDADPYGYPKSACDRCRKKNVEAACDVDTLLGYGCSHCRRDQACEVDKVLMPLRHPQKQIRLPWYRHACDRCKLRHELYKDLEENTPCNWLTDRRLWDHDHQRQACSVCYRDGTPCMSDKQNIIPPLPPASPITKAHPPRTWTIRKKFEVEEKQKKKDRKTPWHEYVEVTTGTTWRKKCAGCQFAGRSVQCLIMWTQAHYACERCTQFGVDCVFQNVIANTWEKYPIHDLSRVGFGQFTPYVACKPCKDNGRHCDRMRPCDSCTAADDVCDGLVQGNGRGLIAREKIAPPEAGYPFPTPGPLYYLALGYGPKGVNDIKDGRSVEHWIGPIAPVYGVGELKDSGEHYRVIADIHRGYRSPERVAPPTIPKDVQSNKLTVEHMASLIRNLWPTSRVPMDDPQAYRALWRTLREAQELTMRRAGENVQLSDAPAIPRTFQGNPVLSDLERFHDAFSDVPPQAQPLPEFPPGSHSVNPSQIDQLSYAAPAPLTGVPDGGGYSDGVHLPASAQQGESIVASVGGVDHSQFDQAPNTTPATSVGFTADGLWSQIMFYSPSDEQEENNITSGARDQQGGDDQQLDQAPDAVYYDGIPVDLHPMFIVPGEQGGDNQQTQQTRPSDQGQSGVDISEFSSEEMEKWFDLGEYDQGMHRGRFMTGQYASKTSRAGRRPIRKARPFANRVPRDTKAKDKTFNPFLSFALDEKRKPRLKARERSSRWKVFNPLEGLDMEKWQKSKSQPDEDTSQPRLFSVVNGQQNQSVLRADVLDDVPYEQIGGRSKQSCAEPGDGGIGRCGHENINEQDQAVCQSSAHRDTAPGSFPVCNDCVQANIKDMFRHECNPIIESELLSMRAYLCNDCAGHISSSVKNAAEYRAIGARRVFGLEADKENSHSTYTANNDRSQAMEFHKDTEALTGCSCANKLFGTSMCRFHRLYYAEEALKFSALVQEWRLSKFKKAVCPSCLAKKPLDHANLSADIGGFTKDAPTAWACMNCNDWVANEKNNKTNQPGLVDKKLWSSKDGRELFSLRQEAAHSRVPEIDDADMGGL